MVIFSKIKFVTWMDDFAKFSTMAWDWFVASLPGFLLAIGVLIACLWDVRNLSGILSATLNKSEFTPEIAF